jgi:hypothetical protein
LLLFAMEFLEVLALETESLAWQKLEDRTWWKAKATRVSYL